MGARAGSLPAAVSAALQGTGPWVRLHCEEGLLFISSSVGVWVRSLGCDV